MKDDVIREKEELSVIQKELQEIQEKAAIQNQLINQLERESHECEHNYQNILLQKERDATQYQSVITSLSRLQINQEALPEDEVLKHADTVISLVVG